MSETALDMKAPPCRICGETKWVAVWTPDRPEETICMECCATGEHEHANGESGHEFDRGSRLHTSSCIHCGSER